MPNKVSNTPGRAPAQTKPVEDSNFLNEKADRSRTFRSTINARLDKPSLSLFRLGIRIFQLCFALGSGISYAIELSHGHSASAFIYSQIVFGLTIVTLVFDALTVRSYRVTFAIEWILCILWLALFGVYYVAYLGDEQGIDPDFAGVNIGLMKRAVWIDLVNFLLWMGSALFSTAMCCSGVKATVGRKIDHLRANRKRGSGEQTDLVQKGVIRKSVQAKNEEPLPTYEDVEAAV